jgi:hypothetical protein
MGDFAENGDHFGQTLVAGDLDGDEFCDLVVGIPSEDVNGIENAGSVHVIYGSNGGLTAARDELWHRGSPGLVGELEAYSNFGYSLAIGNFGKSVHADLAVGIPNLDTSGVEDSGAVQIIYGSASGLTSVGNQVWHQDRPGVAEVVEPSDEFGSSLSASNFGRGPHYDLAVGAPHESIGQTLNAGAVHILFGTSSGLSASNSQLWHQNRRGVLGVAQMGDGFGTSLASANFGHGPGHDLAIGIPYQAVAGHVFAGEVQILYSTSSGLSASGDRLWHEGSNDVSGAAEEGDRFGMTLAVANFGKTPEADLAVGVPFQSVNGGHQNGTIHVFYAEASGLSTSDVIYNQANIGGTSDNIDRFGSALGRVR